MESYKTELQFLSLVRELVKQSIEVDMIKSEIAEIYGTEALKEAMKEI